MAIVRLAIAFMLLGMTAGNAEGTSSADPSKVAASVDLVVDHYSPWWTEYPLNRCVNQFALDHRLPVPLSFSADVKTSPIPSDMPGSPSVARIKAGPVRDPTELADGESHRASERWRTTSAFKLSKHRNNV